MKRGSIERSEERTESRQENRVKRGSIEERTERAGNGPRVAGTTRQRPAAGPRRSPSSAAKSDKRRLPLAVVLGLMLVGGLCALLALNTASAALEVRNRSIVDDNANSSDTEQQLLRDLAAKQAPAALAASANALGMVPNQNPAFLRINANGSVSVLGSPTPATVPVIASPPPVTPSSTPSATPTATKSAAGKTKGTTSAAKPTPSTSSSTRPAPSVTSTPNGPTPSPTPTKNTAAPMISSPGGH